MTLLRIRNLDLDIRKTPILRGVSFSVSPAEIVGLVGESGSGKSLTALSIMQLLPRGARQGGSIQFDGAELVNASEKTMLDLRGNDIGMVFQEPMTALNPLHTIGDQIAEGIIRRAGKSAARAGAGRAVQALLRQVGLDPRTVSPDRYPHELSGGQRQRVVIAMAIALKPKLIIADEPTTALDVTTQAQVLALLQGLVKTSRAALLLISHDLGVVAGLADRVAIMRRGKIVDMGETVALFGASTHPYTQRLYDASSHVPGRTRPPVLSAGRDVSDALLRVENLVRCYPLPARMGLARRRVFRAVDDVSLAIHAGQSIGLVGESGCGKSTLARAVLGLERPDAGRVMLLGEDFHDAAHNNAVRLRRHVQAVFQDPSGSFNPRHRVLRLVAEPLHLLGRSFSAAERRDRVAGALADVGLDAAHMERYAHEFSGGERQRIGIARALITHPKLVVMDEAVSALDVSIRARILDLLGRLRERYTLSYLFITHDLSVVRAITDEILVMRAGRIVERGETAQLFDRARHAYTRSLLAAAPDLARTLARRRADAEGK